MEAAGKTTTLYRLRLGETVSTQPTMGSNVEEVSRGGLKLECWDLGGQDSLRDTWTAYFTNTDGVVLVVDCSNRLTLPKVERELRLLLANEDLAGVPLLVLANKQDIGTIHPGELIQELNLVAVHRPFHVQGCCAVSGEGLEPGFLWLAEAISNQPVKARE